jgi:hypothetical protein
MQILEIIKSESFEMLRKEGLIDEISYRNYIIKTEFRKRISSLTRLKKREIREQLSEEFNIDIKNMNKILYSKHQNKKKIII